MIMGYKKVWKIKRNNDIKVWMIKKIMGQNEVWKIKKRQYFNESMDDEKKIMGQIKVWKIKKKMLFQRKYG